MAVSPGSKLALRPSKWQKYVDTYQYYVSIAAVFLFFADIPEFFDRTFLVPINALQIMILFTVLSVPFAKKIRDLPKALTIWLVGYLLLTLISLVAFPVDEIVMREARMRILTIIYIPLMYVMLHQKSLKHIQIIFVVVGLISVVNCFIQLINPGAFLMTPEESPRPAGFYINPTKAGAALMLSMIFGIDVVKQKYRIPFMLIIAVGILLTFSRSAMITWVAAFSIYIFTKLAIDRPYKLILPIVTIFAIFIIANPLKLIVEPLVDAGLVSYSVQQRLEWMQDPSKSETDDSASERKDVARLGWQTFGESPFWGHGIGTTYKWNARVSTHNMYLYMMADHGIIGLILLPTMIFVPLYQNKAVPFSMMVSYVLFMVLIGFFSHNVMEERYLILSVSFLAAMKTNPEIYGFYDPLQSIQPKLLMPARYRRQNKN
jgi:O-antigen ligase